MVTPNILPKGKPTNKNKRDIHQMPKIKTIQEKTLPSLVLTDVVAKAYGRARFTFNPS